MSRLLKSLELNGFKSFAQRTVLELPEGITAIVGPNGSGKSNVIDAIRWLLGEREARSLRGAKTEDLIFAGTKDRPKMGMAQASLQFSNENNFFPVDFEDIIVSRQASRDGSNQYFINKAEVRLKDLIDFFAHSRLGARGLVVITQGNSDMFIRATPLERRGMIEEILGLREYQLKKTEAERRLENADLNIEKVRALTQEILPHLRSLKRQTARWEKRGELEAELVRLENIFFSFQLENISRDEKNISEKIELKEREKRTLEEALFRAQENMQNTENRQPEEQARLKELKRSIQVALEDRSVLQKELGRLEARLEVKKDNVSGSVPGHRDLLESIDIIKKELESALSGDLILLKKSVEKVVRHIKELFVSSQKSVVSDDDLQNELNKIENNLFQLAEDLKKLEDEEREIEQKQMAFYETFKQAVSELETAKNNIQSWERSHQSIFLDKERTKLRREELERQMEQFGRKISEFHKNFPIEEGFSLAETERKILKIRGDLSSIGEIDEALMKEASETEARYSFLEKELIDLEKSKSDLRQLIIELRLKIKNDFEGALVKINKEFAIFFEAMFGGGYGKLYIAKKEKQKIRKNEEESDKMYQEFASSKEIEDRVDDGVEIDLKLPRKRTTSLEMLSGGEKSLVGIAALFALISVSPPPFLVLDEIDASLDERNARRFSELVKKFAHQTQFVIVTHNRSTMEAANVLYGVTMNPDGTSKVVSLKLESRTAKIEG